MARSRSLETALRQANIHVFDHLGLAATGERGSLSMSAELPDRRLHLTWRALELEPGLEPHEHGVVLDVEIWIHGWIGLRDEGETEPHLYVCLPQEAELVAQELPRGIRREGNMFAFGGTIDPEVLEELGSYLASPIESWLDWQRGDNWVRRILDCRVPEHPNTLVADTPLGRITTSISGPYLPLFLWYGGEREQALEWVQTRRASAIEDEVYEFFPELIDYYDQFLVMATAPEAEG